jgi:4-amino-4-deoxy-L-arabinose transferase-like glycosyltransferase
MFPIVASWSAAQLAISKVTTSRWAAALLLISVAVLFYHLGTPALFEPDEGRNAEKAREILLIHDWVTPHQDFLPVLDKPIFFYWLVALSYKVFGVSEWTARVPSAVAAAGCVLLIYAFVSKFFGAWEALWSGLILVTSAEFFLLARIVIVDMSLTFFITLSLCCLYWASHTADASQRRLLYLAMYAGMGTGTLVKGLVGVVLPGMIIVAFLLLTRQWSKLRKMDLVVGGILFFLIVVPWYVLVELRNPGYLRYFLWEEHFVRFFSPHFHRSQPWYYFLIVLAVGFLPWTFLLPHVVLSQWKSRQDEPTLFLLLWAVLPLLFFSFSDSKLPPYIVPLYPPLAAMAGVTIVKTLSDHFPRSIRIVLIPWCAQALFILCLVAGAIRPVLLPRDIGEHFSAMSRPLFAIGVAVFITVFALIQGHRRGCLQRPGFLYGFYCLGLIPLLVLVVHIMAAVSVYRSAKEIATKSVAFIDPSDQLVLYGDALEGLPFYLDVQKPLWLVWSGKASSVMGSFYVAEKTPHPVKRYGKILFTFDEFEEQWERSHRRLCVFTKEKNLSKLINRDGSLPRELLKVDNFVLVRNQS